jgi:hypothetical protein
MRADRLSGLSVDSPGTADGHPPYKGGVSGVRCPPSPTGESRAVTSPRRVLSSSSSAVHWRGRLRTSVLHAIRSGERRWARLRSRRRRHR